MPETELDHRYSDADAIATDWPTTVREIDAAQLSWLTTVRADGRPHVTPLVSVWLDDAAYFSTGAAEQKALNLVHNPAVVITTGCNTWDRGLDVMIEGRASRVTDDRTLEGLATAWAAKWDGQWQFEAVDGGFRHRSGGGIAFVFRVAPDKVLAFGKGTFSHTRHRFAG